MRRISSSKMIAFRACFIDYEKPIDNPEPSFCDDPMHDCCKRPVPTCCPVGSRCTLDKQQCKKYVCLPLDDPTSEESEEEPTTSIQEEPIETTTAKVSILCNVTFTTAEQDECCTNGGGDSCCDSGFTCQFDQRVCRRKYVESTH